MFIERPLRNEIFGLLLRAFYEFRRWGKRAQKHGKFGGFY